MGEQKDLASEFPSLYDLAYRQYKRYLKVEEIMSRDVVTITTEAPMDEAARIMGEKHVGSLIAVKYAAPVAIVTERDLLSKILALGQNPRDVRVEGVMSYPLIKICRTAQIKDAAHIMMKRKGRLAVFECGDLVGIVTASDLIRSLPEAPETMNKVDEFMTKDIITADEGVTVISVVNTMGKERVGSVIVTRKGEPMGIFTERDLLTSFLAKDKPMNTAVGEGASSPLITAPAGISVHKAAYIMASKHVRRLPIVKDDKLVGIITARDLVEAYAK